MSTALVNLRGRAALRRGGDVVDLEKASHGKLPSDPMEAIRRWDAVRDWAAGGLASAEPAATLDEASLGPPVPAPAQVFALGLNYRDHAAEAGLELPKSPMIFTKFPSCLAGPRADVPIVSNRVDWEVELVAVIGRGGRSIAEAKALEHVAGYCVGQDVSDRRLQFADTPAQFSIGKSLANFGPIGPALVSLDAIPDPNDLAISCEVSGDRMQEARTSLMVFSVPETIAWLSRHCTLLPGDLIFTGTPAGVGSVRNPRRYLAVGDEITSTIEHLGALVNRCVAPA